MEDNLDSNNIQFEIPIKNQSYYDRLKIIKEEIFKIDSKIKSIKEKIIKENKKTQLLTSKINFIEQEMESISNKVSIIEINGIIFLETHLEQTLLILKRNLNYDQDSIIFNYSNPEIFMNKISNFKMSLNFFSKILSIDPQISKKINQNDLNVFPSYFTEELKAFLLNEDYKFKLEKELKLKTKNLKSLFKQRDKSYMLINFLELSKSKNSNYFNFLHELKTTNFQETIENSDSIDNNSIIYKDDLTFKNEDLSSSFDKKSVINFEYDENKSLKESNLIEENENKKLNDINTSLVNQEIIDEEFSNTNFSSCNFDKTESSKFTQLKNYKDIDVEKETIISPLYKVKNSKILPKRGKLIKQVTQLDSLEFQNGCCVSCT